jgi:hypothetical protein
MQETLYFNVESCILYLVSSNKIAMYKLKLLVLSLLLISFEVSAQKEKIEGTIVRFFDGLSELSPAILKETTTDDFLLLEHGEVWNMDTLVSKISLPKGTKFNRVNSFKFIETESKGKWAWVSYHNTADFTINDRKRQVNWLESAVLVKEKGTWKIKMLHSTVIEK